jgi:hypothetical protein
MSAGCICVEVAVTVYRFPSQYWVFSDFGSHRSAYLLGSLSEMETILKNPLRDSSDVRLVLACLHLPSVDSLIVVNDAWTCQTIWR